MNSLLTTPAAQMPPDAAGLGQVRITALEPVVGLGAARAQVALAQWLVAVVQAPAGRGYADLRAAFPVGAAWPPVPFPAGYVLLGYLDPRDLAVT
ncbi:hypothetical protein ACFQ48_16710 [Hymenobacter caeli]|uniref:Uncharacterized protein n=1 Tax=Hymenobacter caeli TaxID=2735894 RepID=A0ABX2FQT2_9BACT|nr:hypothetical protein [Hymenobacter caeli]NRT19346.1 hypothetical protein [Hymenobacter caeli]